MEDEIYYVVLDKDDCCDGIEYNMGLNVRDDDRLRYMEKDQLYEWLDCGYSIANVKIPDDASMIYHDDYYNTNMVDVIYILPVKYHELWDDAEFCLKAVKYDGMLLQFVTHQTEEICLAAVEQNGLALEFVKRQTEEICREALISEEGAYLYLNEQFQHLYG